MTDDRNAARKAAIDELRQCRNFIRALGPHGTMLFTDIALPP